jgi:DUF4097 and DUF4098 domain-containing protein YvlB
MILGSVAALLFAARSSAQTGSGAFREEFHQTYPLNANGRIDLHNINGWVKIASWDRNEVKVDAVKWAYSKERLDEARIRIDASPSALLIRTDYADRNMNFNDEREDNPATVDYTLTVPVSARLQDIKLINGSLEVKNISGDVEASCINGKLTAEGLRGRTELSTINGTLEVAFDTVDAQRRTELKSVNGSLHVTLPSDTNAEVTASTVHGRIENDFGLPVDDGRIVGHKLDGRIGNGDGRVELRNVNGSIVIRRASDGKPLGSVTNLLEPHRDRRAMF